jgi:radical SAM superfamily enzyme YgiQ (UPF0313 family)
MKIFFYQGNKQKITTYTFELLKHIAIKYGHEIVDTPEKADLSGISLTSFFEIDQLRIFRNKNQNGVIIAGGHACNNPSALLRYADYVCLGQCFELFRDCQNISDIKEKEYIVHRGKLSGQYSDYINWDIIPCVQIGKNSYSYLYSMGCRNKCKFCLTSWANKYQVNPNKSRALRIRRKIGNKQLYLITNDFDSGVTVNRSVSDVRIKEYIKNPKSFEGIKLLRLGVESPSESTRKWLSKPIKDDHLIEFFRLTKRQNQRVNIFMMAGFNSQEEWESFSELLDQDYDGKAKIGVIINYFDPCALTPLERYDVSKLIQINIPRIKRLWKIKSARVVIFRDGNLYPYNAVIDTMLNRANWYDVDKILEMRNNEHFISGKIKERKDIGLPAFFDIIQKYGLWHLIDGNHKNECKIGTYYANRTVHNTG